MRTFVAIDLPPEIRRNITGLIETLRPASTEVRWSRPEGLHITLKFIGELAEERLPEARDRFASVHLSEPITVTIRGSGCFPNEHAPRIIWLGIESGPALPALAAQVEEALLPLGIPKETRPFAPHLTLGRLKRPARIPAIQEILRRRQPLEFGSFVANVFYLYESQPSTGGSVYRKIAQFEFAANSA